MSDPKDNIYQELIINDGSGGAGNATKGKAAAETSPVRKNDPYIWGIYIFLLMISVVELFSASSSEVTAGNVYGPLLRHGIFLVLGFGIVIACQKMHYSVFRKLAGTFAVISLILLGMATFMGVEINGAQRALKAGPFTIQPPEIVKLTVIVLLSQVLSKYQIPGGVSNKGIAIAAVIVLLFGGLLYPNGLTNMILLMGASLCMFVLGGMKMKKIGIVICIYIVCGGSLMMIKSMQGSSDEFDRIEKESVAGTELAQADAGAAEAPKIGRLQTQINRVKRHLAGVHPGDTIDDLNRQVIFSKFAQAHGGLIGRGPGNSRESARLPLAFSDYIYSIIIEDTGFVGGVALLMLYLILLMRAGRIASKCSRAFPALLIMGCAILIVFQALVHMAIVTGVFPVSGQPLPFISKGGTSVLVMSAAVGMMLSVAKYGVNKGNKKQQTAELRELPEDIRAANPMQIDQI